MKNLQTIINVVLGLAVVFLLYKQFKPAGQPANIVRTATAKDVTANNKFQIAYINMDSVQVNYELAKNAQKEISKKQSAITYEVEKMEKTFKDKLAGYQRRGQSMSPEEADAARQDLEASQTQIMNKKQSLTEDFNDFLTSKNLSVRKKIEEFLKNFNSQNTYSYIFSYEPGLFYYKDSAYDITTDVVKGLNEQYKAEKK